MRLPMRPSANSTSVRITASASRLAMNTFEQTVFAAKAVRIGSISGRTKASQPPSPKVPTTAIATRTTNNFRTRRMVPRLASAPKLGTMAGVCQREKLSGRSKSTLDSPFLLTYIRHHESHPHPGPERSLHQYHLDDAGDPARPGFA